MQKNNGYNGGKELSEASKIAAKVKSLALAMAKISEDQLKGKQTGQVSRQILLMEALRLEDAVKKISHATQLRASQAGIGAKNYVELMTSVSEVKRLEDSVKQLSAEALILAGPSKLRVSAYNNRGEVLPVRQVDASKLQALNNNDPIRYVSSSELTRPKSTQSPPSENVGRQQRIRNEDRYLRQMEKEPERKISKEKQVVSPIFVDDSSTDSEPIIPQRARAARSQSPSVQCPLELSRGKVSKGDVTLDVKDCAMSNKAYRHASINQQINQKQKSVGSRVDTIVSATTTNDEVPVYRIAKLERRQEHPSTSDAFENQNWSSDNMLDPSPSFLQGEKSTRSLLSETSEIGLLKSDLSRDVNQSKLSDMNDNARVLEEQRSPLIANDVKPQRTVVSSFSRSKSLRRKLWKVALQLENNEEIQTHPDKLDASPDEEGTKRQAETASQEGEEVDDVIVCEIPNIDTAPIFSNESLHDSQIPQQARGSCTVSTSMQESVSCVSDDISLNAISSNMSESASYSELVKYMSYQDSIERGFEVLLHDSERFRRRYFPVIMEDCNESQCSRSTTSCDRRDELASPNSGNEQNKELADDRGNKSNKEGLISRTYSNTSQRTNTEANSDTKNKPSLRNINFKGKNLTDDQSCHSKGSTTSKSSTKIPSWFLKNSNNGRNKALSPASSMSSGSPIDIVVETVYSEAN